MRYYQLIQKWVANHRRPAGVAWQARHIGYNVTVLCFAWTLALISAGSLLLRAVAS